MGKLDEAQGRWLKELGADEAAKKAVEDKKAYEKAIGDSRRHPGEV